MKKKLASFLFALRNAGIFAGGLSNISKHQGMGRDSISLWWWLAAQASTMHWCRTPLSHASSVSAKIWRVFLHGESMAVRRYGTAKRGPWFFTKLVCELENISIVLRRNNVYSKSPIFIAMSAH